MQLSYSLMSNAYDGNPYRIEVSVNTFAKSDDEAGLWLQVVEGCGYDVIYYYVDEIEAIAQSR